MRKSLKIMIASMLCAGVMTMGMNAEAAVQDKNVMQSAEKQGDRAIKAEKLKLTGNIGFDVKERADGTPVIMECNPRATAGVSEFTASGVNLLYLNIKRCLGEPLPEVTPKYGVIMKRRYQEMYWG